MADCVCLAGCLFFNDKMADMPTMANMYKRNYCRGDSSQCARYMVFRALGRESVPVDLFSNMADRARAIIGQA
ncbi:MAG: hypothetical protein JXD23_10710 [Spirochaetales bacterium]|nr:hypothetical protein [Spirochaetales bacterium]